MTDDHAEINPYIEIGLLEDDFGPVAGELRAASWRPDGSLTFFYEEASKIITPDLVRKWVGDDKVHIRGWAFAYNLCGVEGESISLKHWNEQSEHVASLPMCPKCVVRISDEH